MVTTPSNSSAIANTKEVRRSILFLAVAVLAAASTWFYADFILKPVQVADARAHDRPRGNLSDLYPRWLGARELLLHRRNPYGRDITLEIQKGYYGRELDPSRPYDPKDQQAFAYPVYVVFLLAPLISLPFSTIQVLFDWMLTGTLIAGVLLWTSALRLHLSLAAQLGCVALMLGSFAAVQGIKLQQLTLLVFGFMAISIFCISRGQKFMAGLFLALATIKPQLALPMAGWVMLWTFARWKVRRNVFFGFAGTLSALLIGAEVLLPAWPRFFVTAIQDYKQYTHGPVLNELVNWAGGPKAGDVLAIFAVGVTGWCLWKLRAFESGDVARSSALVLALTVLIAPMYAPYNQVLLLPALFLLWEQRRAFSRSPISRGLFGFTMFVFLWPWIASTLLMVTWVVSRVRAYEQWQLPLYATFALPILVFVLTAWLISKQPATLRSKELTG